MAVVSQQHQASCPARRKAKGLHWNPVDTDEHGRPLFFFFYSVHACAVSSALGSGTDGVAHRRREDTTDALM